MTTQSTTLLVESPAAEDRPASKVRGRPRKNSLAVRPKKSQKLFNKIMEAVNKNTGQPLLYGSTTKGTMKLVYDGHHFRYSFRKGKYTIFQCCYKENKEECPVRIVTDQKLVFTLDGEHIHFVAATDKSVTSVKFTPGEEQDSEHIFEKVVEQQQPQQTQQLIDDSDPIYIEEPIPQPMITNVKLEKISSQDPLEFTAELPKTVYVEPQSGAADDANEFREKIKKRLQKALLGKKKQ